MEEVLAYCEGSFKNSPRSSDVPTNTVSTALQRCSTPRQTSAEKLRYVSGRRSSHKISKHDAPQSSGEHEQRRDERRQTVKSRLRTRDHRTPQGEEHRGHFSKAPALRGDAEEGVPPRPSAGMRRLVRSRGLLRENWRSSSANVARWPAFSRHRGAAACAGR